MSSPASVPSGAWMGGYVSLILIVVCGLGTFAAYMAGVELSLRLIAVLREQPLWVSIPAILWPVFWWFPTAWALFTAVHFYQKAGAEKDRPEQ